MYRLVLVAFVGYCQVFNGLTSPVDDATRGTELVFAFMIHRHGDRTPLSASNAAFSNDPVALQAASIAYGYGQLSDLGKQRAYRLGQFVRNRYGELLSAKFNRSEIYIRSTDVNRCKMTILVTMAAVYPAEEPHWSRHINWEPVPYTVVPIKYDFIQAAVNCPKLTNKLYASFLSSPASLVPYHEMLKKLSTLLGYTDPIFERMPVLGYVVNDLFNSQVSLGVPLTPELEDLRPQLAEVAGLGLQTIFGDKDYFALQTGPLLREFLDFSEKVIAGENTQKVRIYCAHDMNVYALAAALQLSPNYGAPKYTALLSLELRRNMNTGEYNVVAVYLPSPDEKPAYLQVKGCEDILCSFYQFHNITSPYALDVDTWRSECGWTYDLIIDDSENS